MNGTDLWGNASIPRSPWEDDAGSVAEAAPESAARGWPVFPANGFLAGRCTYVARDCENARNYSDVRKARDGLHNSTVEDMHAIVRRAVKRADRARRATYAAVAQIEDARGIEQRLNVANVVMVVAGVLEDADHLREILEFIEADLGRVVPA